MDGLAQEAWVCICIVVAATVVAILYTLARAFGHERDMHDLKRRVTELRRAYQERLAAMADAAVIEVDEAPPLDGEWRAVPPASPTPAATQPAGKAAA